MMWYNSYLIIFTIIFVIMLAIFAVIKIVETICIIKDGIINGPFVPRHIFYGIMFTIFVPAICFETAPVLTITLLAIFWVGIIYRIYCYKQIHKNN